tara:strand:+ start:283 stop:432 length:150 start_codon:yes stop_codon:yes gene_type:complete
VKWYFIYLMRYFKGGRSKEQIENVDWFLRVCGHKRLLRLWRKIHAKKYY